MKTLNATIPLSDNSVEQQLRQDHGNWLRIALDAGRFGTWHWDLESGVLHWDRRLHRLFGLEPGGFSGQYQDFLSLLHPEDRGVLADQLSRIFESGDDEIKEVEFRVVWPDGSEHVLADRSEAWRDESGRVRYLIGVTWEVTQRKQVEQALQRAKEEAEAVNQCMTQDLAAAARVQQALLPENEQYQLSGVETCWAYRPCQQLAGDSLSVFCHAERYLGMYVLDVCGHGVSSALLAVNVAYNLSPDRAQSLLYVDGESSGGYDRLVSPAQVLSQLNRLYPMDSRARLYFTCLYGILDCQTGQFCYASAGNQGPTLVRADGTTEIHDQPAVPIGLLPDSTYQNHQLLVAPGDSLYLHTDGISEERNSERMQFGRQRLSDILSQQRSLSLKAGLEELIGSAMAWCGALDLNDDLAIIGVRRNK